MLRRWISLSLAEGVWGNDFFVSHQEQQQQKEKLLTADVKNSQM